MVSAGIAIIVIAMLSWGLGDFLIQKSSRKIGDWETLFVITTFGTIILIPFVAKTLPSLFVSANGLYILIGSAILLTAAAIFQFESFKRGKISIVETIVPLEIPAASILAFTLLGDVVSGTQLFLIITLILGLFLISFRGHLFSRKMLAEKGVFLAVIGALIMGAADFLLGWGSRVTDPVTANFAVNVVMMTFSGAFLILTGRFRKTFRDIGHNKGLLLMISVTDNIAWLAYAAAMTIIPIAVATGLSESSVIIAVLLGLFMNKEKLERHQKIGLVIAIISAITLAFITSS